MHETMSTPQDSPRRKKQKIRRAKQLAKWREKHPPKPAEASPEKKAPKAGSKGAKQ
jgi:hypothetical protein